MPSLKDLRGRINSVKSTRKITSAMKMVAASKLRRAQSQAEAARPYALAMERMLGSLANSVAGSPGAPRMLAGTGRDQVHLLVAITADRGLAGAFNSQVGRMTRVTARRLQGEGKTVKLMTVGRKGRDYLRREFAGSIVHEVSYAGIKRVEFAQARELGERIAAMLSAGEFDVCTLVYNRFASVISQVPTEMQLSVQIYRALLESGAGEHGARMSSMDNATRNAGDMINRLTLNYNRTRQANITKELIEIISGAEAV